MCIRDRHELGLSEQQVQRLESIYAISKSTDIILENGKSKKAAEMIEEAETESGTNKQWIHNTKPEKISYIIFSILKVILFIVLLYLFLLSLNFMTIGFTMVSGYAIKAAPVIRFILANPFAALAIGIVVTAIMQNATATTSIVVSMVGADIIPDVQSAIPIIMGKIIYPFYYK